MNLRWITKADSLLAPEADEATRVLLKRTSQVRAVTLPPVSTDDEKRVIRFIASDESQDRMGDIIRVAGWKLDSYNGAFLWCHDKSGVPIGTTISVERGKVAGKPALLADVKFPTADEDADGDRVYRAYKTGRLKSVSVGFLPLKVNYPKTLEERTALGLGQYGAEYQEQELLEISACPVPMNRNTHAISLRGMVERGLVSVQDAELLRTLDAEAEREGDLTREVADEIIRHLKGLATSVQELRQIRVPDGVVAARAACASPESDVYDVLLRDVRRLKEAIREDRQSETRAADEAAVPR